MEFTEDQKRFLSSFSGNLEISNLKSNLGNLNEKENIYFLAGGKLENRRNNDCDMELKNYFFLDFDIRKKIMELEKVHISDEDIIEVGLLLGKLLNKFRPKFFENWRWIVFSGNGIHLYYVGKPLHIPQDITPREFSAGVRKIYEMFDDLYQCSYVVPDYACRNIARVARLPDTINQKTGQRCRIIAEQERESEFLELLPQYGKEMVTLENTLAEKKAKEYALTAKEKLLAGKHDDLLKAILEYPVESLLIESERIPIFGFNGKNFIDPRDRSYYGFWKAQDGGNYIVCGGSTTLAPYTDGKEGLNAFDLVKNLYSLDNKGVFNFFRKKLGNQ